MSGESRNKPDVKLMAITVKPNLPVWGSMVIPWEVVLLDAGLTP